jgi:hypothetical protein
MLRRIFGREGTKVREGWRKPDKRSLIIYGLQEVEHAVA